MKILRSVFSIAMAAAFSVTLLAQQPTTGYHRVACIKVKPGQYDAFRKWAAGDAHKVVQAEADSGELSQWLLLRSVIPEGASAECDYLAVAMYPGLPPQPSGIEHLAAALKNAGLTESAQQFAGQRSALTTLISNNLFQNVAFVGASKKGDYLRVNYMKVSDPENMGAYFAYEKKVWQPLAEQMAKDNVGSGWSLNVQVLPRGNDLPYDAVTVDVFPTWDSVFQPDTQFEESFRKVHPDMDLGTTMETYDKMRSIVTTELYSVVDMVTPAK
ncbi:MAG: hypothetical protein ACYCOR_16885 [Acidobacteriaceae bacterium]